MIFASRGGIVERSSRLCGGLKKFVFTVLLVRRFFVSNKGRDSRGENEMLNKFSFANRRPIYRVEASRCVAAINLNFKDL